VVLVSLSNKIQVDLMAYLFGSITTVQTSDLWIIVPLGVVVIATIGWLYRELSYLAFDDESAKVSGLRTQLLNQLLIMLAAVTVVVSLRIVGGLLIGALMVIPVAAAMQVARSFRQTVVYAMGFGLVSVVLGLAAAFYLNLAAGGAIVIVALLVFFGTLAWRGLVGRDA
jgi:zinc transport system permease protein